MPRWFVWTLLTLLSWGIWAILPQQLERIAPYLSSAQCQAASTVGLLPIVVALWGMKGPATRGHRRRGIALAFGSGIVSCLGNVACYAAMSDAKAATVVPLTALYPVVTILLAAPLLKERITPLQCGGVALSLVATLLFNPPGEERGVSPWMLLALLTLVLWGVAALMQKASTFHLSGPASAFWFLLAFVPIGALIVLREPLPSGIPGEAWAFAAALGFTLGFGNLTVLLAYSSGGKAAVIAPLSGLYSVVSIPLAILLLGERIGTRERAGIALALVAVVLLSSASEPERPGGDAFSGDPSI